jgi:hypothetical protein
LEKFSVFCELDMSVLMQLSTLCLAGGIPQPASTPPAPSADSDIPLRTARRPMTRW